MIMFNLAFDPNIVTDSATFVSTFDWLLYEVRIQWNREIRGSDNGDKL